MVRAEYKKLNISVRESHLIDIYSDTSKYLELGTIHFAILKKLLKYEQINFKEIAFLPIQNFGIGKSTINNENLKSTMPYYYFNNVNQKNKPYQVFLTHGLIRYRDLQDKEIFSPLILIPVEILFDGDEVYIQMISEPIENKPLLEYLDRAKKILIPSVDKLDTLGNIEKYFMNILKYSEFNFEFENYMTYAYVQKPEIIINQNKFNLSRQYDDFLYENLFSEDHIVFYSKKHNRKQRRALMQAIEGESFVIAGRLGTGKTTVMKDIAVNAISSGKRVLYVSNVDNTLNEVNEFMKGKGLGYYVTNFTKPFSTFLKSDELKFVQGDLTRASNFDSLLSNYKYINDYQLAMTGRVLDHRFIDVVNELINLSRVDKEKIEIDNLSDIYKHEYLEIVDSVKTIQQSIGNFDNFKDSIWKDIPIINDIKYPNQVMFLIHQVYNGFDELKKYKDSLIENYKFVEISNYAFMKNIINNITQLPVQDVPKSWAEQDNYEKAKTEYHNLKNLIFTLQELEYDLDIRFENLDKFEIKKELEILYGSFFTSDNLDKINKIIDDRLEIVVTLNKITMQIDIFNKAIHKIKNAIDYNFELSNDVLNEVLAMSQTLLDTKANSKFIKAIVRGEFENTYNIANKYFDKYNDINNQIENLFLDLELPNIEELDIKNKIQLIIDFERGLKLKRPYRQIVSKLKAKDIENYKSVLINIKKSQQLEIEKEEVADKFIALLDCELKKEYLDDFKNLYDYVENIEDAHMKAKILKSLRRISNLHENQTKNFSRVLSYFIKSHQKIIEMYKELLIHEFVDEKNEFDEILKDIYSINSYIKKLNESNDTLYSMKKISRDEYIKAQDYYYLDETYNKIAEVKEELKFNKEFPYLFGSIYKRQATDLAYLARVIQAYRLYVSSFESYSSAVNSLNPEVYSGITNVLNKSSVAIDDLNEVFKQYFKIFKNSVSQLYYGLFDDNLSNLLIQMENREDLITYLKITDNLQVLEKYHLYKLIEHIVSMERTTTLLTDFKFTYFSTLNDIYLKDNQYLRDYKTFELALKTTVEVEEEIMRAIEERIVRKIIRRSVNKYNMFGFKHLDYNAYLKKTNRIKHLVLTNTQILNNFIDPNLFDLILIDDAHIFSASEYVYALEGKQVIVSGELQFQEAALNNLISRISMGKSIELNYRYDIIPKGFKDFTRRLKAPIYNQYYENYGVEIIEKGIYKYVANLFTINKNCSVNLFIADAEVQRQAYDKIANFLLTNNFKEEEIIEIYKRQLNIVDLKKGYLINANYNVLFIQDYYELDTEYLVVNMIDNLILTRKKLIIYDNKDFLSTKSNAIFLTELNKIINSRDVFKKPEPIGTIEKLISALEAEDITCFASELGTFIIKVGYSLYGITVYWDSRKTNYDILNEFRDIHSLKDPRIKKNIIVWSMELIENFDGVIQRILKEVAHDSGK